MNKLVGRDFIKIIASTIRYDNHPIIELDENTVMINCELTEIEVCWLFINSLGCSEELFYELFIVKCGEGKTTIVSR